MKPHILLLTTLFIFFSCGTDYRQELKDADACIEDYPDSALSILNKLDFNSLEEADRMLYRLLRNQALYKTDQANSIQDLSLCIDYFKQENETNYLQRALFYKGEYLYENNGPVDSMLYCYYRAERLISENSDSNLVYRIYNRMSCYFSNHSIFDQEIIYTRKTINYILQSTNTYKIVTTYGNHAIALVDQNRLDSAEYYIKKALNYENKISNESKYAIYNNAAYVYANKKDLQSAEYFYKKALTTGINENFLLDAWMMNVLLPMNRLSEANSIADRLLTTNNIEYISDAHAIKSIIANKNGEHELENSELKKVCEAQIQERAMLNAIKINKARERAQAKILAEEQKEQKERLFRKNILAYGGSGLIFVMIIILIAIKHKKKLRKRTEAFQHDLNSSNQKFVALSQAFEDKKRAYERQEQESQRKLDTSVAKNKLLETCLQSASQRYQKKENQLKNLESDFFNYKQKHPISTQTYKEYQAFLFCFRQIDINEKNWLAKAENRKLFLSRFNTMNPNIPLSLTTDWDAKLSPSERIILRLKLMKKTNEDIMNLMGITKANFYTIRSRFTKKVQGYKDLEDLFAESTLEDD